MCRGGKDGTIRRCQLNERQHAAVNFRKKVKYRADKAGISTEEWKEKNPELTEALIKNTFPQAPSANFQDISETRCLPDGIPVDVEDHIEQNKKYLEGRLTEDERKVLRGYTGFTAGICNTVLLDGSDKNYEYYNAAPPWRETDPGPCDFVSREDLVDYMDTLDSILDKRNEDQRILYRGNPIYKELQAQFSNALGKKISVNDTESMLAGIKAYYTEGKVFEHDTYLSTSHSAHYVASRCDNSVGTEITYYDNTEVRGLVFELKTNAGLDVTSAAGGNYYEREVLLPRDTKFKVVGVHLRPESYDTVSGYDRQKRLNKKDLPRKPEEIKKNNYTSLAAVIQMVEVDKDGNEITHTENHVPRKLNLG